MQIGLSTSGVELGGFLKGSKPEGMVPPKVTCPQGASFPVAGAFASLREGQESPCPLWTSQQCSRGRRKLRPAL